VKTGSLGISGNQGISPNIPAPYLTLGFMRVKPETAPPIITTSQAGRILDLTDAGVRHLVKTGKLRVAMRVGSEGARLFRRTDVETLARARAESRPRRAPEPNRAA
jgi:hypothetical protein